MSFDGLSNRYLKIYIIIENSRSYNWMEIIYIFCSFCFFTPILSFCIGALLCVFFMMFLFSFRESFPLDPRAGGVDVLLPQLPVDYSQ